MNENSKIQKIQVIYNPDTKKYEKAYVTINGKTEKLTENSLIIERLKQLKNQEGKKLNQLSTRKLETVFSNSPVAKDKEKAWANAARLSAGKVKRQNPYTGKRAKNMPKKSSKLKKGLLTGGLIAGVALAVTSCGLTDKIASIFNKDAKSVTEEELEAQIIEQFTDREILEKDFDYYADNYEYGIQQEVAYTANTFLEQANTNIKNLGLKTEDNKDITGLFTAEEAWVYAITINNLSVDQIIEIYNDSKFDYAKFEDTKQMMITKMMQYQMLVAFGRVEQLDFTAEFMTPHDDFVKEVFNTLATDIEEIGKNIDNKTVAKEKIKTLHDDLVKYADSGNLSQNVQDMLQVMYSPAYFSGVLTESAYGKLTYFTKEFGEDLVGKGLCTTKSIDKEDKETEQEVQSQHDSAWADAAANLRNAQKINNEEYTRALTDKNSYVYWMNEACQSLANEASRADKHLYASVTDDNSFDVHNEAEMLVKNYLVEEKGLKLGSDEFKQAFNNIVTDKQDGVLAVETILSLISDNALVKGYNVEIDGYTLEELQYQLSLAVNAQISEAMLEMKGGLSNGGGSTALPKDVQEQITITREEAVSRFGESAVQAAEKAAFDNEASQKEAEKKAEEVKNEAQNNLDSGNYDDLIDNAGKHDPANKDKYEDNAEEAIKNKKESDKITSQGPSGEENITHDYEKDEGTIEVEQGTIPDGAYTGDINWSNGETLGGNADKVVEEKVTDPTTSTQEPTPAPTPEPDNNSDSVSGGDITYDIPEDMFEPVEETTTEDVVNMIDNYEAMVNAYVEELANNPTAEEEVSNQLVK